MLQCQGFPVPSSISCQAPLPLEKGITLEVIVKCETKNDKRGAEWRNMDDLDLK